MLSIRVAGPDDALVLAELAETTFRETFAAVNTPANMDLHCLSSYGEARQARELSDPAWLTLLCAEADQPVGFAQLRRGDAPDCVAGARPAEIHRFYVRQPWHGSGVARELMNTCLGRLAEGDADIIWLGVWEHNPRAIAFYRRYGFTEVGDHVFPVGDDPQRDIVMVRR